MSCRAKQVSHDRLWFFFRPVLTGNGCIIILITTYAELQFFSYVLVLLQIFVHMAYFPAHSLASSVNLTSAIPNKLKARKNYILRLLKIFISLQQCFT